MSGVQHSSKSDRWYTPEWLVEKARAVLGTIDLDPASEAKANEVIRATHYLTEEDDALSRRWTDTPVSIFCNPPGGKIGNRSRAFLFWREIMKLRSRELLKHAIFVCFSAEALQTTQGKDCRAVGDFYVCIPKRRIAFVHPDEAFGQPMQPTHANAIVYVPGIQAWDSVSAFLREFRAVGTILKAVDFA